MPNAGVFVSAHTVRYAFSVLLRARGAPHSMLTPLACHSPSMTQCACQSAWNADNGLPLPLSTLMRRAASPAHPLPLLHFPKLSSQHVVGVRIVPICSHSRQYVQLVHMPVQAFQSVHGLEQKT